MFRKTCKLCRVSLHNHREQDIVDDFAFPRLTLTLRRSQLDLEKKEQVFILRIYGLVMKKLQR